MRPRPPTLALAFVLLSLLAQGYRYGVADHGIHLAFVDMVGHPGRWAGDLLELAKPHHHSLLWPWLQLPPAGFFALHVASLFAVGLAIVGLGRRLGGERAAPLALILLATAQPALGGVDTFDPLVLNRTLSLPIELFALRFWLRGCPRTAFALLGVAACVHVPSAAVLAVAMTAAELARGGRLVGPGIALVLSMPVVLPWLLGGARGALTPLDPAWAAVLDARMSHHLDAGSWGVKTWLAQGAWLLAGGLAWRRQAGAGGLGLALIAVGVGIGGLAGTVLQLPLALQLEAWQAFRFVTIGCALLCAGWLARLPLPGGIAVAVGVLLLSNPGDARWQPAGPDGDEAQLAQWIGEHLPEGSFVAVPPDAFDEARPRARRALYVTWKDGGEALFDRGVALEWRRRIERSCACRPFDQPLPETDRLSALRHRLRAGSDAADPGALAESLRSEGVTHLVLRGPRAWGAPLHTVGAYALYALPP